MILLVASTKDVASMNIRQQLLANYGFEKTTEKLHHNPVYCKTIDAQLVKLLTINKEPIYYKATNHFHSHLIIHLSRHSSKSGTPTLSVHTPGNLAEAQKGGIPSKVSIAPAYAMRETLSEMTKQKQLLGLDYDISYECTHHGPSLDVATMFVELGSSSHEWKDEEAAEAIAHAVMASIAERSGELRVALGIGGPHYNKKFTRMAIEGTAAFGHMISKYQVPHVNRDTIAQCIERTLEKVDIIVLDWKGIKGADKARLMGAIQAFEIEVQKT